MIMKICLLFLSFMVAHGVLAGTSVITLLEDDVSDNPLCQDRDLLNCQKAQVDVDAIVNSDPLMFPPELLLKKTLSYDDQSGTRIIELKANDDNSSMALITITDEDIVTISIDTAHGIDYNLLNCGPGLYLWRTINETFYDHLDSNPKGFNQTETDRKLDPALVQLIEESRQSNQQTTMTIKLYYTPALRDSGLNVKATLANNIAQTNAILRNTNIPLTVVGICAELMDVSESGSGGNLLNSGVFYFSSLSQLYDGADLAMLVTRSCRTDSCGVAATINVINPVFQVYNVPVRFAWTVAVLNPFAIFAHELGHLLGGEHDRRTLGCGQQCPRTAHGYSVPGLPYHTVMAYRTNTNPNPVPYFSTPTLGFNGGANPIGTPVDDVRSTIIATRFAISQLGNDQCQRGCFNRQSVANCCYWRQQGFCQQQYVAYMRANCALACGFC